MTPFLLPRKYKIIDRMDGPPHAIRSHGLFCTRPKCLRLRFQCVNNFHNCANFVLFTAKSRTSEPNRLFEHNFQLWLWKVTQAHAISPCESHYKRTAFRICTLNHVITETSSGKKHIVRDDSSSGTQKKANAIKSYYTTHPLTRTHTCQINNLFMGERGESARHHRQSFQQNHSRRRKTPAKRCHPFDAPWIFAACFWHNLTSENRSTWHYHWVTCMASTLRTKIKRKI